MRGAIYYQCCQALCWVNFNPRSPCGERFAITSAWEGTHGFQSTLPMRGAIGERPRMEGREMISIHAPHAGSDYVLDKAIEASILFQSTLPMRGAISCSRQSGIYRAISIHAPHAGSDCLGYHPKSATTAISIHAPHAGSDCPGLRGLGLARDFNPRSPCGERLVKQKTLNPCGIQHIILRTS